MWQKMSEICLHSSVDRASVSGTEGRRSKSCWGHQKDFKFTIKKYAPVAQRIEYEPSKLVVQVRFLPGAIIYKKYQLYEIDLKLL